MSWYMLIVSGIIAAIASIAVGLDETHAIVALVIADLAWLLVLHLKGWNHQ